MKPKGQAGLRHLLLAIVVLLTGAVMLGLGPGTARAFIVETGVTYGPGSEADPNLKQLDIYRPDSAKPGELRPVVVYVHGGGWAIGDKKNKMAFKPRLFTDQGYVFVSVNYRLSPPVTPDDPQDFDPGRLRYPEHPRDVAEAIAWVGRNIRASGGDPDTMILLGHSAGAHLVSLVGTNPAYVEEWGASLRQVTGVVSLDAGAFDVVGSATQTTPNPTTNNLLIWNAFGTPAENAMDSRWKEASPITWAEATDPRQMLVTQAARPARIDDNERMADALGQDPLEVFKSPLDHEGLNDVLGDPADSTGETTAVLNFISSQIARERVAPQVDILKRPAKKIQIGRKAKTRKIVFRFLAIGNAAGVQCRLDRRDFSACRSPHSLRVRPGSHQLRFRALYPSGRPGAVKDVKFKVVRKKHWHR